LIYLAIFFFAGSERLPRLVALYLLWDAAWLVFGWRLAAQWSFTRMRLSRRILVAGSGRALRVALDLLKDPSFKDAELVGVLTDDVQLPASTGAGAGRAAADGGPRLHLGAPLLGALADVDGVTRRLGVTDVVVAMDTDVGDEWVQHLLRCQEAGTGVMRMAQLYERTLGRVPVEHVESSWLLTSFFDVARFSEASPLTKRVVDIGVALALSAVGLCLTPFIVLAVLMESGRPILYRQPRLGRGGQPFLMTKFRTMSRDAESDGQARWSVPGDRRVTRVGRLLRRTRLDELPNLLNVLRGEMSMVGPRPERPQFIEQLEREVPLYRARLIVAPGLTGWAQVNWPYGDSVADAVVKLEFDLYYIKHQSLWFDMAILLRTVGTMLRFRGR
jgi:exopolysaccharide biosynthesis polyprenyl glycosylphosphotransferase